MRPTQLVADEQHLGALDDALRRTILSMGDDTVRNNMLVGLVSIVLGLAQTMPDNGTVAQRQMQRAWDRRCGLTSQSFSCSSKPSS